MIPQVKGHKTYPDWIEDKALSLSNGTITREYCKNGSHRMGKTLFLAYYYPIGY